MKVATNARRSESNASSVCVFIVSLQKPQPAHDFQCRTVVAVLPGLVCGLNGSMVTLKQETHLGRVGSVSRKVCSIYVIR